MILNDTHLAVLRVLAAAEGPMTIRNLVAAFHAMGPGNYRTESGVRSTLKALEWNEGTRRPLAQPVGTGPRGAQTWAITDEGRQVIKTEDARSAR